VAGGGGAVQRTTNNSKRMVIEEWQWQRHEDEEGHADKNPHRGCIMFDEEVVVTPVAGLRSY